MAQQQQAIHKFVLGSKELEGKTAEFLHDRGWYSITDIVGEERNMIYKSRNAQEAYMKWNVYIGRKKERPVPEERRRNENDRGSRGEGGNSNEARDYRNREHRESRESREYREENGEYRDNRRRHRDNNYKNR